VTSVGTGIGFTPLLLAALQTAVGLWLPDRTKSHVKTAFGAVRAAGKRRLYPDSCHTRLLDFHMTLSLLPYLNATGAVLCARESASLRMGNVGVCRLSWTARSLRARDRPCLLRYRGGKARAMEEHENAFLGRCLWQSRWQWPARAGLVTGPWRGQQAFHCLRRAHCRLPQNTP